MNSFSVRGRNSLLFGAAGVAIFLTLWELLAKLMGPTGSLPGPVETSGVLVEFVTRGKFWLSVQITLLIAAKGLLAAILFGTIVGLVIGASRVLTHATRVPVHFLKAIPPIVILPVAVLALGPTREMAEFLVFFGCALPIVYQTAIGVKETDPVAIDTARSYGLKRVEILYRIVLPSASAFIWSAIRISMPMALIVTIVAGLLGGGPGLGRDVLRAASSGDHAALYALVFFLGAIGLTILNLGQLVERKLLRWHASYRTEER